jgi:predicted DCC family thiol-disulfide oxidoreductase YuxK
MPCLRLRLLYDGECPFCRQAAEWVKRRDEDDCLILEDVSALGFDPGRYGLSRADVQRVLHGVKPNGTVLRGLDVIREACRLVGLGWLVAPTRLPLVRTATNGLYWLLARYRASLGSWLPSGCPAGTCAARPPLSTSSKDRRSGGPLARRSSHFCLSRGSGGRTTSHG